MVPKGKLIIEVGLKFENYPEELQNLKELLKNDKEGPRKDLHDCIGAFLPKINPEEIFMCSIKDPDEPEEEDSEETT